MKPPTVFLGEMTSPEVERFLADHDTAIVPVGSTEQHGPHGPLLTDALVPTEVARRVAPDVGAVVAPTINYGLSYPHIGFTGLVHVRIPTFMAFVEDVVAGLAAIGFRRIVLLNGHYDNTYALAYACANVADRLPEGTRAFPINYWDGITAEEAAEFFGATSGLHANRGETSAVLAINPALVDMDAANAEMPPFPEVGNAPAVHTAFFFSAPGSVHRATQSGTWGDAREATPEFGERYLQAVTRGTLRLLDDIERTFTAMPPRSAN
jgi:creatinine amidohydrolase